MNPILGYVMVWLDNGQNTCQIGVTGYRWVWGNECSEWLDWIELRPVFNEFEKFIWVYNDELYFLMMKITLKNVLGKVSIKPFINRVSKNRISQFSYTCIVVTWT